ncbi:MAG: SRPBCC family protein [Myxococcota bacterium]|nr:SRPBCC family protein [Myxococcota bacterium]
MLRLLFIALLLSPAAALAQTPRPAHDALEAPLRGFSRAELRRIEPLLDQGIFGLVETREGELLPGIHLAARVHAPAEAVTALLAEPTRYPEIMPALDAVTMREETGQTRGFSWQWRTSVFTLGGDAMITVYRPRPGQERRGARIVVERTEGDLGHGREVWRVLPRGPRESLLLLSTRMDIRGANPVTRQMRNAALSRSINLAMSFGMLLRLQEAMEAEAGWRPPALGDGLHRPRIEPAAFEAMMRRGDLLLVEARGDAMRQATVLTRYNRTEEQVRGIMLNPVAFAQALIQGSSATLTEETEDGTRFDWRVDLPLIGTGGAMILREREDAVVELEATDGALAGGRWEFETTRLPSGATGVIGWASFDVGTANFLLRAIVDADESFRTGLTAATQIMFARALRIRLRRVPATGIHRHMR